jgi:hypothetical protein
MVDLRTLVTPQRLVFVGKARSIVGRIDADDALAVARVSLPIDRQAMIDYGPHDGGSALKISSRDLNMRFHPPQIEAGADGVLWVKVGFGAYVSLLSVARLPDRLVILDGNHRGFALLERGVTFAPAVVRDLRTLSESGLPSGLMPEEIVKSDHPPLLRDYCDPDLFLEASCRVPKAEYIVRIERAPSAA